MFNLCQLLSFWVTFLICSTPLLLSQTTTNISSDHNDIEKEIVHASELYRKFAQHFYHKQLILRCSGMARVNKGSHSFTYHPHVYPQVE